MKCFPLCLLLLALSLVLAPARPAVAQAGSWAPPTDVSGASFGWFPDMAIGPEDSVHIVWHGGAARGTGAEQTITDLLMYRELRNGVWSQPNDIAVAGTGGYTVRNSMVLGYDGRLHVLLRNKTRVVHTSAPWSGAWNAQTWSDPRTISGAGAAYYTALAMDGTGILHALWSEAIPDDPQKPNPKCLACSDMFYRQSSDGGDTWSPPINLSQSADGENRPQIMIDKRARIHAVWDEGADWYAGTGIPKGGVYRRSDDRGATWSAPALFQVAGGAVQQTTLALSAEGNPMLVYRGVKDNKVYVQRSADGGDSWSEPAEIPGVLARDINDNNLDSYSMATDSAGRNHLVMSGFLPGATGGSPQLLHLSWDGTAWSAPDVVMRSEDLYPEWPRLIVSGGNRLHVVWFTRNREGLFASDSKRARYQIWYSSTQIDAPATGALSLFTPTPTIAPTATPAPAPPTPTPTALPLAVTQAQALSGPPQWEMQGLLTIVIALLPTIGLLAVLLSITWRIRRRR